MEQHSTRFEPEEMAQLRDLAKKRKVTVAALMRAFTLDGMRNEMLLNSILEQEFTNLRREDVLTQTLACTAIAATLQLGVTLLEKNPGETDEAFTARKKAFLDSSLQNAFRLGNQVFDIQQASRRGK
jgi:hypothetical protein